GDLYLPLAIGSPINVPVNYPGQLQLALGLSSTVSYTKRFTYAGQLALSLGITAQSYTYTGAGALHFIEIVRSSPRVTIAHSTNSIEIERHPMGIVENTTVTLDISFRDRLGSLVAPATAH